MALRVYLTLRLFIQSWLIKRSLLDLYDQTHSKPNRSTRKRSRHIIRPRKPQLADLTQIFPMVRTQCTLWAGTWHKSKLGTTLPNGIRVNNQIMLDKLIDDPLACTATQFKQVYCATSQFPSPKRFRVICAHFPRNFFASEMEVWVWLLKLCIFGKFKRLELDQIMC